MFNTIKSIYTTCISILMIVLFSYTGFASNANYAALPPFLSAAVKPNVLIVMDFSGSMQAPAYHPTVWRGYFASWVGNYGNDGDISVNYVAATTYYGYFDSTKYYEYNNTGNYWEIKTDSTQTNNIGTINDLSGNLLNFLTMSRVDAALKSLIGGKADCPVGEDYCLLKPQGSTRWVEVDNLDINCHIRPNNYTTGNYKDIDKYMLITIQDESGESSDIGGTFIDRYARVKINSADRTGIIQENNEKLRFGFIAYSQAPWNTGVNNGTIKYGFNDENINDLISVLETTAPYAGTNTGEAMREAYYYLTQSTDMALDNSGYESPGTSIDPFYELKSDGTVDPAWCRKNFVILLSDGEWNGTEDPDEWAHKLHTEDLRTDMDTVPDPDIELFPGNQNATVYTIFAFSNAAQGAQSMKTVAAFGAYEDTGTAACTVSTPFNLSVSSNSKTNTFPRTNCNPSGTYNPCCAEWDSDDSDGIPDGYFEATDGQAITNALTEIFDAVRLGTSSGTALTALTSKTTTGSVVTQAIFYPKQEFLNNKEVTWTGNVFTEWFLNAFIDDATGTPQVVQNIREDSNSNRILNVETDRILEYLIVNGTLQINAYDSNEYGTKADNIADEIYTKIEEVANLSDCGEKLKNREPADRTIYGVAEDDTLTNFTAANFASYDTLLGNSSTEYPACLLSGTTPQYGDLIDYTRGEAITNCRSRATSTSASENVWKLGDIIYSSPTIVDYNNSAGYAMIYTGSNDGMLHAFRLGFIKNKNNKLNPAQLCNDNQPGCLQDLLGKEEWAFVPKDIMPYLRYMADPDYDHIYTVDLKPYIITANGKIILIGGMRMGGATENGTINPPSDTDPIGRSAYFALDITDPQNPIYLWRYAPDGMGFTYSGPAYVKRKDSSNNWKHFITFASGPTNYNGSSTQDLQIFTIDLFTGAEIDVYGDKPSEMNMNNAFGGRLFTNGLDVNEDGQTDFIFIGYTDMANQGYEKMKGGIIKVWTGAEDLNLDPDPSSWDFEKNFLNFSENPIIAPVKTMKCFPDIIDYPYLYFATGRYFVSNDVTQDGPNDINHLYGVPFSYNAENEGEGTINSVNNSVDIKCLEINDSTGNFDRWAWKVPLTPAGDDFLRERSYSDPTTTDYNIVFFNTAMPTDITCACGGRSRAWALNCATGGGILSDICEGDYIVDPIEFKFLVQLSGGDIQQYDDGDFGITGATEWTSGVPSEQGGLPIAPTNPGALGQILYWKQW